MLHRSFLLCVLCLSYGLAFGATRDSSAVVVSSQPEGASIFHYLRGAYYFLGYTPMKVTKEDLDGKVDTRLLLVKYGYNQSLVDLSLDGGNQLYELSSAGEPYLLSDEGVSSKYSGCRARVSETIQKLIHQGNKIQIDLQLPARWSENGGNTRLVVMASVLNHDDISGIKQAERRNNEAAIAHVNKLLAPITKELMGEFGQLDCLQYFVLIVAYHEKGLKVDFTPYEQYWTATSSTRIGNREIITTAIGATTELDQGMVVINKKHSFVFSHKLH